MPESMDPDLLAFLNGPPPHDEFGVDLSIIRSNLKLTLEQRAEQFYQAYLSVQKLKAFRAVNGQLLSTPQAID